MPAKFEAAERLLRFNLTREDLTQMRTWRDEEPTKTQWTDDYHYPRSAPSQDRGIQKQAIASAFREITKARQQTDWDTYIPANESRPTTFLRKAKP
jgi:hypothetical protein